MLLEALLQVCSMWYFHFKLSSMKVPKNLVTFSLTVSKYQHNVWINNLKQDVFSFVSEKMST